MDISVLPLEQRIAHARKTSRVSPPFEHVDLRELFEARSASDRTFLIFRDSSGARREWSYAEFSKMVLTTCAFLHASGLCPGDRIATFSTNHWQTVVHYFAAWVLSLVVVPVNTGEDDARIAYILAKAGVKLVFVRENAAPRLEKITDTDELRTLNFVKCNETIIDERYGLSEGDIAGFGLTTAGLAESDAFIVFTSGTTGNPKGVVLTQRNLMEDARAICEWHGIDESTRMMCVLPIHHVNGTVVTLLTPFFAGGSVVLNEKFSATRFFETVASEGVHIVSVVPTLLQYLTSEFTGKDVPRVEGFRHIICGAGPLTVSVASAFEDLFKLRVVHGYGLSETTCYSCYLPLDLSDAEHRRWMRDYGYPSIGVALDVNEMDIHDSEGRAVGDGVRGEIVIRGYNVMREYYLNEAANESAFTHGWFRSGDEGFTQSDEAGCRYFFITGRLKELIIRGGVNLSPLEIDDVLAQAPGVEAGIAVGFENDWYGEEVGAYVLARRGVGADAEAVLEFCRGRLPFAKCPKVVVFGEEIPVTSTGKYQRMKVAHLFSRWKSVQFRLND